MLVQGYRSWLATSLALFESCAPSRYPESFAMPPQMNGSPDWLSPGVLFARWSCSTILVPVANWPAPASSAQVSGPLQFLDDPGIRRVLVNVYDPWARMVWRT